MMIRSMPPLAAEASTVRRVGELEAVDALVIPGGESTTMSHLLREFELLEPLRSRLAEGMPAYGSCAGMILLATEITGRRRCRPRGHAVEGHRYDGAAQRLWPPSGFVRGRYRV